MIKVCKAGNHTVRNAPDFGATWYRQTVEREGTVPAAGMKNIGSMAPWYHTCQTERSARSGATEKDAESTGHVADVRKCGIDGLLGYFWPPRLFLPLPNFSLVVNEHGWLCNRQFAVQLGREDLTHSKIACSCWIWKSSQIQQILATP